MTKPPANGAKVPGRDAPPKPLPKRFYKGVSVARVSPPPTPTAGEGSAPRFRVLLDGKPIFTPAKAEFVLPSEALATAIAAEWEAQRERIDPRTMALTRLANSALDGVRAREADVRGDIVKYAGSDLVCYRADQPDGLVRLQAEAWDPVLAWADQTLGARFAVADGIMPVAQSEAVVAAIARALDRFDAFSLAGLHVLTTLTGSALLALALEHGRLSVEQAWAAAHLDEDWQISRWGEDAEAKVRRARRWAEMQAAHRLLELLG